MHSCYSLVLLYHTSAELFVGRRWFDFNQQFKFEGLCWPTFAEMLCKVFTCICTVHTHLHTCLDILMYPISKTSYIPAWCHIYSVPYQILWMVTQGGLSCISLWFTCVLLRKKLWLNVNQLCYWNYRNRILSPAPRIVWSDNLSAHTL